MPDQAKADRDVQFQLLHTIVENALDGEIGVYEEAAMNIVSLAWNNKWSLQMAAWDIGYEFAIIENRLVCEDPVEWAILTAAEHIYKSWKLSCQIMPELREREKELFDMDEFISLIIKPGKGN